MNKKHSKDELHNLRSYNAEHEKRDSEGRFESEYHHNPSAGHLHDERSRNAQKEKRDSDGRFEK